MLQYFDIHDQKRVEKVDFEGESLATPYQGAESLRETFNSSDVRKITLSQYRRLAVQYAD